MPIPVSSQTGWPKRAPPCLVCPFRFSYFSGRGAMTTLLDLGLESLSSLAICNKHTFPPLSRIGNDHWSAVYDGTGKCGTVGRNKDSLYEHTAFGTMCCGERDKVCCLTCRTAPGTPSLLIIPSVSSRAGSLPRQLDNVQGRRGLQR